MDQFHDSKLPGFDRTRRGVIAGQLGPNFVLANGGACQLSLQPECQLSVSCRLVGVFTVAEFLVARDISLNIDDLAQNKCSISRRGVAHRNQSWPRTIEVFGRVFVYDVEIGDAFFFG